MPDETPEQRAHGKIIDRCIKRRRSSRPAYVVDRIRVTDLATANALRDRMKAAGLNVTDKPRDRPLTDEDFRQVTLPVVNFWDVMVDELAAQQGIPAEAGNEITAAIRAITALVTGPPNLIGFDFADLRTALHQRGRAVFGEGEAEGPDRALRAAEAALAELTAKLREQEKPP